MSDRHRAALVKYLWDRDNSFGRYAATFVLLFMGPIGWLLIIGLWIGYFIDKDS